MTVKAKKIRADELIFQRGLAETRSRAKTLIMMGKVSSAGKRIEKAGDLLLPDTEIEIEQDMPFVSRGGLKLAAALDYFAIDLSGSVAADLGASTGGFTDCLLQRGAAKVYAVDVGYGLLDAKLRKDSRVVNIEKTNIRHIAPGLIPEQVDFVTMDLSFISLTLVLPAALTLVRQRGGIIALIKPQFELSPAEVGKGGIVRDPVLHEKAVDKVTDAMKAEMDVVGVIPSPVKGQKGNQEFLVYAIKR